MVFAGIPACLLGWSLGSSFNFPPSQPLLDMGSLNTSSPIPGSFSGLSLTCKEGSCPLSPLDSLQVKDPWLLPLLQPGDQLRLEDQESCCGMAEKGTVSVWLRVQHRAQHPWFSGVKSQGATGAQAEPLKGAPGGEGLDTVAPCPDQSSS